MTSVLLLALSKWYGGADVRVHQVASALEGQMPYSVVTLHGSLLHQKLRDDNLNVIGLPYGRGDVRMVMALQRIMRERAITILDAHNPQSYFWGLLAARTAGLKSLVATVHSSGEATSSRIKTYCYDRVIKLYAALGAQHIAVSPSVADYLAGLGIAREKIALIPNAVPIPDFQPHTRNTLRHTFGWDERHFVMTTVARLEAVKGLSVLIEALKTAVVRHPTLRSLIVGEGREYQRLKGQVQDANLEQFVHFAGFRTDIPAILAMSDAFCLPSFSEGLPFALLEACACRVPALVTRVGGMAEFFADEGTALMVPPGDSAALAKAIVQCISHPDDNKSRAEAALLKVSRQFSVEQMIADTLDVYRRTQH